MTHKVDERKRTRMNNYGQDRVLNQSHIPEVAILLATYNGERFLEDQLESFVRQTITDWVLWVSDDGSSDQTLAILNNFSKKYPSGKVNIINGPKTGFANNFLSLIRNSAVRAKNYAYSDQDDVWFDDKLERAINYLNAQTEYLPALYCSRTQYVDENMLHIGYSDINNRPPSFLNAIVQNIASGNTMVFNEVARALLMRTDKECGIPLHDWWTYILVTASGGKVFFDQMPSVRYRQHDGNLWGMNTGWTSRAVRMQKLFEGRFQNWNTSHIQALRRFSKELQPENHKALDRLNSIREQSLPNSLCTLKKSGLYRQTLFGNIGLWVAVLFRKI